MEDVITNNRKAGFWVRAAAIWVDILIICLFLTASMVILEQFGIFDNFEYLAALCGIAYLSTFIGGKGRTVGKVLCGLTAQKTNNTPIGYLRGILREIVGKPIAGIFLFLGFFWAGLFRSKRGWHDYVAHTMVIQDNKAVKRGRLILTAVLAINVLLISSVATLFFINAGNFQKKNVLKPESIDVNNLTESDYEPFVTYLKTNGKPPIEYVIDKFKQHDVVMLGEMHETREVCEFISNLIEPLCHEANVKCFAMEVLKYKNQHLANQLVTGEKYDDELVLQLFRDCGWPSWGFQEYMDILKAIWQVNRTLPPDKEKIKVVCLDSDWDGSVLWSGQQLWKLPDIFYRMATRDNFMAKVLEREVLQKGEKALVQVGGNHAFTHYRQPLVKKGKVLAEAKRFGFILHRKYDDRIFDISVHKWHFSPSLVNGTAEPRSPLGGLLEDVFKANENKPIGFDVIDSPFAALRDSNDYFFAYQKYVIFSDVAQGYVFLKPLKELNKITWAKGFINEENFEVLKKFLTRKGKGKITMEDCRTPEDLDEKYKQLFEK